jgi:ferredoxin
MTDNSQSQSNSNPINQRKIRGLTMKIDRNLCIGAATCVAIAPKAWTLDNQAKAVILDTAEEESDEVLIEAAKGCPVAAIIITDASGKQIFP